MATNVSIGGRTFACLGLAEADFTDVATVYVILCVLQDGSSTVLDVGQSRQLGSRIVSHERKTYWTRNYANNSICVYVYRMPSSQYTRQGREKFETQLRNQYRPPCSMR